MSIVLFCDQLLLCDSAHNTMRTITVHHPKQEHIIMPDVCYGLHYQFEVDNDEWLEQVAKSTTLCSSVAQEDTISECRVQLADNVYNRDCQDNLTLVARESKIVKTTALLEYYNPRLTTNCMIMDSNGFATTSFNVATEHPRPMPMVQSGQGIRAINSDMTLYSCEKLSVKRRYHQSEGRYDNVTHAYYESGCLVMISTDGELVVRLHNADARTLASDDYYKPELDGSSSLTVPHTTETLIHVAYCLSYTNSPYVAVCDRAR